jgi:dTDP-4-dehydrorhamnose 3,5-epimerase
MKAMASLTIEKTAISGLMVLTPHPFRDDRGVFTETWNRQSLLEVGLDLEFVQDNHSLSRESGTLRGLHFQLPPYAQDKLIRCTRGAVFDVAVDIRLGSATYGEWLGVELTPANGRQLLVPIGFLHGFVTREPHTEVQYKCTNYYAPDCDRTVRWDSLGIDWNLPGLPVLSAKDAEAIPFANFQSPFTYDEAPT